MRPFNSALIAAALLVVAAPSFAQYRPNQPGTFPGSYPSTYPTTNPGSGPMANGQHPLWGIVGEVVRTVVERTVPQANVPQQPGGQVPGTYPQANPYPQNVPHPQATPYPQSHPYPQPRPTNAAPQQRQIQQPAPRACVRCDPGPQS